MRTTSINVQITKCPRQYEAVRLGMDVELETGDNAAEAIKKVTAELNAMYNEMYAPAPVSGAEAARAEAEAKVKAEAKAKVKAEAKAQAQAQAKAKAEAEAHAQAATDNREPLAFSDPRLQQILRRMEKVAGNEDELKRIYDNTYKYFIPDENAAKTLKLAAAIV